MGGGATLLECGGCHTLGVWGVPHFGMGFSLDGVSFSLCSVKNLHGSAVETEPSQHI